MSISGGSVSGSGGGVLNSATLIVNDCTLSGNSARQGGGIDSDGILTISNSTLSGNSAGTDGGSVFNSNQLTVTDSTLSGNVALGTQSEQGGGGIYSSGANTTVSNSTLSGNSATQKGGGVFLSNGNVLLTDDTLAANTAAASAGGGGACVGASDVIAHNTLIATNLSDGMPSDISGSFNSASTYDLIGDGSGGLTFNSSTGNIKGTPDLALLGYYGGPTETMPMLPDSLGIGKGSTAYGSTDQRGMARGSSVDIGAFQTQASPLVVNTSDDTASGAAPSGELSLRDAINLANVLSPSGGASGITFNSSLALSTITLAGSNCLKSRPI